MVKYQHEYLEHSITRYVSGKSPLFFSSLIEDSSWVGRWVGAERRPTFGHSIFRYQAGAMRTEIRAAKYIKNQYLESLWLVINR